jgi:hypothetical protein
MYSNGPHSWKGSFVQETVKVARAVLWVQIVLAVAASALMGLALASSTNARSSIQGRTIVSGAVVSTSILIYGVLLIVAAVVGLIAIRRRDRVWFLRAGIALLAPAVIAVASAVSTGEETVGVQAFVTVDMWASIERTLRLMEWASWLLLATMLLATLSAVLLLLLRRKTE